MSTSSQLHNPAAADAICDMTQVGTYARDGDATAITVEDLVAEIIAAEAPVFDGFDGKADVPATLDDLKSITIDTKACGSLDGNGAKVLVDMFTVQDVARTHYTDDQEGGIGIADEFVGPTGSCQVISLCFEKCVTKEEFAALPV